jgi:type I restriction enzyme, S subunit
MTWPAVPLGTLATFAMGQAPPSAETNTDGIGTPFYRSGEFGDVRPTTRIWTTKPLRMGRREDVFICVVGANSGEVNLGVDGAIGRSVAAISPDDRLDQRFLFHLLSSRTDGLRKGAQGSAQGVITKRTLAELSVPLPPLDEQRRLVELLEDHLSRLDAGDAYLAAGQRRLDAMERAVLASSRDGELFPLAEVTAIQGGIQKQQKRAPKDNAFPFLRVANVTARGLDLADVHSIELFDRELDRLRLRAGDLLVVEGNGSASQIGRAAMWDGSIEDCVHQNHLIRVRPLGALLPEYLEAVWNSPQNRAKLTDVASSSSGLHTLSVSKLKQLSIPVPPIDRQHELVAAVSEMRGGRGQLSGAIATAAARKRALQRSLLVAAFSGRLTGAASTPLPAQEMTRA